MKRFIAKAAIALALGLLVLLVLDGFNPLMAFLTSTVSKVYICLTCAVCVTAAGMYLAEK